MRHFKIKLLINNPKFPSPDPVPAGTAEQNKYVRIPERLRYAPPIFCGEEYPKFLNQFYKLQSPSNM